ncbi:MAG: hypothetical protein KC800_21480, partial [Candidatus Eremiobacteraeota bacterium]|nr:hypothetical protein [Candidatus Eremiobacteraeota bacterium]
AGVAVVVEDQKLPSASAAYEPWLGETIRQYGSRNFGRFATSLAEDLAPTLEQVKSAPNPWRNLSDQQLDNLADTLTTEPDPSRRALGYRTLAAHNRPETLRAGLFDNYHSNRWLCMELLKEPEGDMVALMPSRPLNVFHFRFLENALRRTLPDASPSEFFALQSSERAATVKAADLERYLALARQFKKLPMAASALFLFGTPAEQREAIETIKQVLLAQGNHTDVYHGPDFWLRGDLIQVLANHPRPETLSELFRQTMAGYKKDDEMFLLALAYAMEYSKSPAPGAADELSRVRDLDTDNYDLYLAAALALSRQDRGEGEKSLLHVLSLQRQPFVSMALLRLEQLAEERTPGWGEADLHPDPEAAYSFWKKRLSH